MARKGNNDDYDDLRDKSQELLRLVKAARKLHDDLIRFSNIDQAEPEPLGAVSDDNAFEKILTNLHSLQSNCRVRATQAACCKAKMPIPERDLAMALFHMIQSIR